MSGGINLARLEAEHAGLAGLRAGTGGKASAGELEELRHQQRNMSWDAATPYLHDAAQAFREVMGSRRDGPSSQPSKNSFLK